MVEHLVCNQAVVGSNPVASTTQHAGLEASTAPDRFKGHEQRRGSRRGAFFENKVNWFMRWQSRIQKERG